MREQGCSWSERCEVGRSLVPDRGWPMKGPGHAQRATLTATAALPPAWGEAAVLREQPRDPSPTGAVGLFPLGLGIC